MLQFNSICPPWVFLGRGTVKVPVQGGWVEKESEEDQKEDEISKEGNKTYSYALFSLLTRLSLWLHETETGKGYNKPSIRA